jgi:hypothetical protein
MKMRKKINYDAETRAFIYKHALKNYQQIKQKYEFASVYFHLLETLRELSEKKKIDSIIYSAQEKTYNDKTKEVQKFHVDVYHEEQLKSLLPEISYCLQLKKIAKTDFKYNKLILYCSEKFALIGINLENNILSDE